MATPYSRVIVNGAYVGYVAKQGVRSAITERTQVFPYIYQNYAPYMFRDYAIGYPDIYSDVRLTAWFIASGYYNSWFPMTYEDSYNNAYFAAYEKFKGACGDSAQLGASIAESKEAFSMIATRAGQLFRAARALKRLRFGDFIDELALVNETSSKIRRKVQRAGHDLSSVWLEYSYGWKPLLHDIYDAVKVLESPYKETTVRARGTHAQTASVNMTFGHQTIKGPVKSRYTISLGGKVSIENRNLAAASQAGLINPLVPLWEILPFSFVIDWFTPIGNFLENFTFGMGLSITHKWSTQKLVVEPDNVLVGTPSFDGWIFNPPKADPSFFLYVDRYTIWSIPSLPSPRFPRFPRDRALNALSLTIQMLSSLQSKTDNPRRVNPRVI